MTPDIDQWLKDALESEHTSLVEREMLLAIQAEMKRLREVEASYEQMLSYAEDNRFN